MTDSVTDGGERPRAGPKMPPMRLTNEDLHASFSVRHAAAHRVVKDKTN